MRGNGRRSGWRRCEGVTSLRYANWIIKGAGIGLTVAFAALASGDSPNPVLAYTFDILDAPVGFAVLLIEKLFGVNRGDSVGFWLLLHFVYWMTIGALVVWGAQHMLHK